MIVLPIDVLKSLIELKIGLFTANISVLTLPKKDLFTDILKQ